jgi:hypothetical protein
MDKPILLTIAITVIYFLVKMVEMKYIEKETKPIKLIVRDLIIVFMSALVPIFLFFSATGPVAEMIGGVDFASTPAPTQIFTDQPGF